jgi:hypothetical protein
MEFFETAYHGLPPWDIGRLQREFIHPAESKEIAGDVLDVGCGMHRKTAQETFFFLLMHFDAGHLINFRCGFAPLPNS